MSRSLAPRDVPLAAVPGFGPAAIARIHAARVLLVGAGGLGCAVAPYLVGAGVGTLRLCDHDVVAASNLGRQILYGPADIGRPKVAAAIDQLAARNDAVVLEGLAARATAESLARWVPTVDLVIDATDNYGARLAINDACLAARRPWVMGAVVRAEGQLIALRPDRHDAPCYRCVYGDAPDALEDCAGGGIVGPAAGVVGSAMALAALQLLADSGQAPTTLQLIDLASWEWRRIAIRRDPACPACGASDS